MDKINDCYSVEEHFKEWLSKKYPKARHVSINKIWKEKNDWFIEGQFEVQSGLLGKEWKLFKLKITSEGNITGYDISEKEEKMV